MTIDISKYLTENDFHVKISVVVGDEESLVGVYPAGDFLDLIRKMESE